MTWCALGLIACCAAAIFKTEATGTAVWVLALAWPSLLAAIVAVLALHMGVSP